MNNEVWSTTGVNVSLYVQGWGWTDYMQFRNQGQSCSGWESCSLNRCRTLSTCGNVSPETGCAQIGNGPTVLESSDQIHVDIPFSASPGLPIFLSELAATPTVPESYAFRMECCHNWTAQADRTSIKLSDYGGAGPTGEITACLRDLPTSPNYTAAP